MPRIFIVAVENSADHLGAALAESLRDVDRDIEILGIGGSAMRGAQVPSQMDIDGLAILGFVEGLKSYPIILKRVEHTAQLIMQSGADAAVLIDSWGFMIRVAKRLKKMGYTGQIIKYVAPQVWAMREGRSKILAQYVDHLLTIHSFDAPYFTRHGLPVHYVGNPVFDTDYNQGDPQAIRQSYDLGDRPIVGVFLGSRGSEIYRLAPVFAEAIEIILKSHPDTAFVSPVSNSVAETVGSVAASDRRLQEIIFLTEAQKFDVMACAHVALACSGTVTTQLACAELPTVVAYKLAPATYHIAKHLFKPDYISIVNIAADAPLMPEFVQNDATGKNLGQAVIDYLDDPAKRKSATKALLIQTDKMRGPKINGKRGCASARAAEAILNILA